MSWVFLGIVAFRLKTICLDTLIYVSLLKRQSHENHSTVRKMEIVTLSPWAWRRPIQPLAYMQNVNSHHNQSKCEKIFLSFNHQSMLLIGGWRQKHRYLNIFMYCKQVSICFKFSLCRKFSLSSSNKQNGHFLTETWRDGWKVWKYLFLLQFLSLFGKFDVNMTIFKGAFLKSLFFRQTYTGLLRA